MRNQHNVPSNMAADQNRCRLCGAETSPYAWGSRRNYLRCSRCGYVQVPQTSLPDPATERERYLLHNNDPNDHRYRNYLNGFLDRTVRSFLPSGRTIVDIGSGPKPVAAQLLHESGYAVSAYDPFFAANPTILDGQYNAVVSIEVVEHVHQPDRFFDDLFRLLTPGGMVFIRTELWNGSREEFSHWWYQEDVTHVGFFSAPTFQWISTRWPLTVVRIQNNCEIVLSNRIVSTSGRS